MITLRRITQHNEAQAAALGVREGQEGFVMPNADALAEARLHAQLHPMGIYHNDEMVGFLVYSVEEKRIGLWRFMIGAAHQRRGYGAAALALFVADMQKLHPNAELFTTVDEANEVARWMYIRQGFAPSGRKLDSEDVLVYRGGGDGQGDILGF